MALTAQQIVALSVQAAHCTGFIVQAGELLNVILANLADTQDLDLQRTSTTISLTTGTGQGPYALPTGYRRACLNGVFYTPSGGANQILQSQSQNDFNANSPAATGADPVYFWVDLSPLASYPAAAPNLYVWDKPTRNLSLTVNYFGVIADIPTPETSSSIPWFPNQKYLITELTAQLMDLVDDTRAEAFHARADAQLAAYLTYANDDEGHVKTAQRDARRDRIGI